MEFLKLNNIGKIYVSEGNVAVGIRGVNLSFELGEFVAITGASGSGKSTLLNVLSGMDTYEEGELFIEGKSTSHYLQPDWEEYRQKYISFIFQDYNIIDSFTVLQNVELALMTIADPVERRRRAIELIERVGLKSHMKHKGSQLSGGQKQRTVIARALAKDSPIILADEPTGNLDSETSKEIVELLREVSKNKLLIMVTHNFDQVEHVATRHIRVYDGAIESDRVLVPTETVSSEESDEEKSSKASDKPVAACSNGLLLGRSLFFAKPRLSTFLCILMIIGTAALFLVTIYCGDFSNIFRKNYMFRPTEGRLVLTRRDGAVIDSDELFELANYVKAKYLRADYMFDCRVPCLSTAKLPLGEDEVQSEEYSKINTVTCTFDKNVGKPEFGRYPESDNEVFLNLPLYYRDQYTESFSNENPLVIGNSAIALFHIVGVRFYADNSQVPLAVFTEGGFHRATLAYGLDIYTDNMFLGDSYYGGMGSRKTFVIGESMPENTMFIPDKAFRDGVKEAPYFEMWIWANLSSDVRGLDFESVVSWTIDDRNLIAGVPIKKENMIDSYDGMRYFPIFSQDATLYISQDIAEKMLDTVVKACYHQASLFFDSDDEAEEVAEKLREGEYVAVTTSEKSKSVDLSNEFFNRFLTASVKAVLWVFAVLFLMFFINLCSHRSIETFRDDMSIMRSMGIPTKVIRIGLYVRMFLSLVPAFVLLPIAAYYLYQIPEVNIRVLYLRTWHYVLIYAGMLFLTYRISKRQCRKVFENSVKKSLRGGDEA